MFKFTASELDNALAAIQHHGYSTLIPEPLEWRTVVAQWPAIRDEILAVDIDEHRPYATLRTYAPKSRYNVRAVTLLHPQDLLIYTALTMIAKNDIEASRLPRAENRVFSYRVDINRNDLLYTRDDSHEAYLTELRRQVGRDGVRYVGITDIGDFYPRLYHHRLENAIASVASSARVSEVAGTLARFLNRLARGDSYGLPVGPLASRILGEAVLIDVDEALRGEGIQFARWVDDYNFFCSSQPQARAALFYLAQWLFEHHGLTLQPLKTKVLQVAAYRERVLVDKKERLARRIEAGQEQEWARVFEIMQAENPYLEPADVQLSDEDIEAIEAVQLEEMLEEALADLENVDYEMAAFILGQVGLLRGLPDESKESLLSVVLEHIADLHPVAESVARFLLSFDDIAANVKQQVGARLIEPLLEGGDALHDYYAMWALHVLGHSDGWVDTADLFRIFRDAKSQVVRGMQH